MAIVKDTKDWTWVLGRVCDECGFDATEVDRYALPSSVRRNAAAWLEVLALPGVRRRPARDVWSPLEYGCHVRDVFRVYDERLRLMLEEHNPLFANWDQDDTAVADRYWEQDPVVVSRQLLEAADTIARHFARVDGAQWSRTGRRSDGASFTVDSFARYFLHDVVHHLHDVS
jgi:DinB family protein